MKRAREREKERERERERKRERESDERWRYIFEQRDLEKKNVEVLEANKGSGVWGTKQSASSQLKGLTRRRYCETDDPFNNS
ncbi:hypothetical protein FHG87_004691 [Trinorchestia longiramus]|nr:hypothetical protein FHG87_004691 [Trinorchestia longiramus]